MISSHTEWFLNQEIKSKYKRYLGLQSSFSVLFPYNSFTAFIDQEEKPAKLHGVKKRDTKMDSDKKNNDQIS